MLADEMVFETIGHQLERVRSHVRIAIPLYRGTEVTLELGMDRRRWIL